MAELHQAFNETVNLGLLEGIYVRYVHVLETTQPLRWIVKPGARDFFHTTALGRAIVAQLPEEQQSRLVAKVCAALPTRSRKAVKERAMAELGATRSRGCALEEEETVAGVACAAISLGFLGEPHAGVSVSVPVHRYPERQRSALIQALISRGERPAIRA